MLAIILHYSRFFNFIRTQINREISQGDAKLALGTGTVNNENFRTLPKRFLAANIAGAASPRIIRQS